MPTEEDSYLVALEDIIKSAGSWRRFGAKATNLSKCLSMGVPVPNALAVDVKILKLIEAGRFDTTKSIFEKQLVPWLLSIDGLITIRSSELISPELAETVSGHFQTIRHQSAVSLEILEALHKLTEQTANNPKQRSDVSSTVLFQKEIQPSLSGYSRMSRKEGVNSWIIQGDLAPLMSGEAHGEFVKIPAAIETDDWDEFWCEEEGLLLVERVSFASYVPQMSSSFTSLFLAFGDCSVEWCIDDDQLWILQVQPTDFAEIS
ncbi:hypothetical protein [Litoreibacter janthinus]|uniref:Uncharacterized protein n=1 Tax=Litoreibacter janthinus TaxID=670154 RepID=A0A1I6HRY0_9RHOB|nr:hypothetical protein [Litoreibacter janthinus]SFR57157.1 hypothetical protein SAMN04488002_3320 [Litoreibacter janthinus]